MTIYSQRDPRWKNILLGFSKLTIGDYGCTLTSLAMALGVTPDVLNEKLKSVGAFSGPLLIWGRVQLAFPQLKFIWRSSVYENDKVKAAIAKNGFCLVEVDFDGKISSPKDSHWVLFIGNHRMYDPWTGVEKSTSYYPLVKGYAVFDKI